MFPSNNRMEFMSEMNRLLPRNNEFEFHSPMTSSSSHSFSHSIIPSSSSTETSPESYPEVNQGVPKTFQQKYLRIDERPLYFEQRREECLQETHNLNQRRHKVDQRPHNFEQRLNNFEQRPQNFKQQSHNFEQRPEFPNRICVSDRRQEESYGQDLCDTPYITPRQRPIIGRKIMATTTTPTTSLPKIEEMDTFWSPNDFSQQTSSKSNSYELFPVENKGFEFRTPVRSSTPTYASMPISPVSSMTISPMPMSPQSLRPIPISPVMPQSPRSLPMSPMMAQSPRSLPMSQSPRSLPMSTMMAQTPKLVSNLQKQPKMIPVVTKVPFPQRFLFQNKPSTLITQNVQDNQKKICTFCRKNGETPLVFMAHSLKENIGDRSIITCPILRRHVCQICGASGDNAHTITYCPVLRSSNNGMPLLSTTITLKNTRIKSNGRRRF